MVVEGTLEDNVPTLKTGQTRDDNACGQTQEDMAAASMKTEHEISCV